MPFFDELTLSGAGRVAEYQGAVGHGLGLQRRRRLGAGPRHPLPRQLRPRGPRSERFGNRLPAGPELRARFTDPCNPSRDRQRAVAPPTAWRTSVRCLGNLTDVAQSLPIVSGSNPNLRRKRRIPTRSARSSSRAGPGLVAVDRLLQHHGEQHDRVADARRRSSTAATTQPTLDKCSAASSSVAADQATVRDGRPAGRILGNSLIQAPLNFAKRVRRGHRRQLPAIAPILVAVEFDTSLIYTHNLRSAISRIRLIRTSKTGSSASSAIRRTSSAGISTSRSAFHLRLSDALHRTDVRQPLRRL